MSMKEFKKTDPEFYQIITDFVYDEACKGNLLDKTERYMCILAGLMGVQGKSMFRLTIERALEDDIDPEIPALLRPDLLRKFLSVPQDAAAVSFVDSAEDLDKRGLSGTVLTDKSVDLPGIQRKVEIFQRIYAVKFLVCISYIQQHPVSPALIIFF